MRQGGEDAPLSKQRVSEMSDREGGTGDESRVRVMEIK